MSHIKEEEERVLAAVQHLKNSSNVQLARSLHVEMMLEFSMNPKKAVKPDSNEVLAMLATFELLNAIE